MFSIKKILLAFVSFLFFIFIFFFVEIRLTAKSVNKLYSGILNNQTNEFSKNYTSIKRHFGFWKIIIKSSNILTLKIFDKKLKVSDYLEFSDKLITSLPEILGKDGTKIYYVLLQNNTELRPTGGFLGSYAKLKFKDGSMSDIIIQDIYVPDGKIKGHVDPPVPIQEAFKQGWYRLRDANFDPDFPKTARTVGWFFEKGEEEKADGIIGVNLIFAKDLLSVTGPLELPDYKKKINTDNFFQILESASETDAFAGSTQKADIMSALGRSLLFEVKKLNSKKIYGISKIIFANLNEKNILVYFNDAKITEAFHKLNWDGALTSRGKSKDNDFYDYFYLVEANLGANKANCCVEREVDQEIDFSDKDSVKEKIKVNFINNSNYFTPIKPIFWGGNYINFIRFYLPMDSSNIKARFDDKPIEESALFFDERANLGTKGVGFFITIPYLSKKSVEINYEVPSKEKISKYHLSIQKQPGIEYLKYSLTIKGVKVKNGNQIKSSIFSDKEIILNLMYN